MGELENDGESRKLEPPFDLAHVGSMDACLKTEFLLGNTVIPAKFADFFA